MRSIHDAARESVQDPSHNVEFNGVILRVKTEMTPEEVVAGYHARYDAIEREYMEIATACEARLVLGKTSPEATPDPSTDMRSRLTVFNDIAATVVEMYRQKRLSACSEEELHEVWLQFHELVSRAQEKERSFLQSCLVAGEPIIPPAIIDDRQIYCFRR